MNNEKYTRIKNYLTLISPPNIDDFENDDAYESKVTIESLATAMNLPIEIVRNDIANMTFCINDIYFGNDDIDNELVDDWDNNANNNLDSELSYINRPKVKRRKAIIKGEYDNIPIDTFIENVKYTLTISEDEAFALAQLGNRNYELSNHKATKLGNFSRIKTLNDDNLFPKNSMEMIDNLLEAIEYKHTLKIIYIDLKGTLYKYTLFPVKIAYDNLENGYYLIAFDANSEVYPLKLDRIQKYSSSKTTISKIDTSILEIAPFVWGMSFRDTPQKVKVRFKNEANVFNKVRRDLSTRTKGSLYEKDGFLFYEDTVYGISNFKNWIFGYGSSVIVEKPASLRKQIIDSYKRRLKMYDN